MRMSKLASKLISQFMILLALMVASLAVVTGTGAWGMSQTRLASDRLYNDQLRTVDETANVGQELDDAYESAQAILLANDTSQRQRLATVLFQDLVPSVEVSLNRLQRIHAGDPPNQLALVHRLVSGWSSFRALWNDQGLLALSPDRAVVAAELRSAFGPLGGVTDQLLQIEQREASQYHQRGETAYRTSLILIAAMALTAILLGVLFVWFIARRVLPRAMAPEEAQAEFAEAMQLAGGEIEAQRLLTRHLERSMPNSLAVVFNRGDPADRLEPSAPLPDGSSLKIAAERATANSCAAIRTARLHVSRAGLDQLVPCDICSRCPGTSMCAPLAVGGEIVGSVLVNRDQPPDADDERRFHDSIIQATPVLTNLRNLALAEMQASTDSLTGLPNKRSVQVEVTRMVAQANRAVTPLAALALDIDHFKRVNDTYGHGRGDEVLAAVGGILQAVLRTSDSVGRTGGEEFLVLLPSTDLDGALAVAENIREGFAGIRVLEVDEPITVSIGIAVLPRHATDAEGLQRSADRALYLAKANGRDRIELAPENQDVAERAYALPRERPAKEPSSVSDRLTSLNRF